MNQIIRFDLKFSEDSMGVLLSLLTKKIIIMKIVLPELKETLKFYNNSIVHLKDIEREIEIDLIEKNRSYFVFNYKGDKYCITGNKNLYPKDINFVLLSDSTPTEEKIDNKKLVIKKWIKHPKSKVVDVNTISESWKDSFVYKNDEISQLDNGKKEQGGLRKPQLGAIHNILGHFTNSKSKSRNIR